MQYIGEENMIENRSTAKEYKYDVAVSYDSHSREMVRKVVTFLKCESYQVFFDVDRKSDLLSENLEGKLYQVYQNESLVKVLFVTDMYLGNEYTLLEARRSFTSVKDNHRRLIIVNLMGKSLPEPYNTFAYLDGNLPADEIAYWIGERVKELKRKNVHETKTKAEEVCAKKIIGNINIIGQNNGVSTRDNATISNISIH